MEVPPITFQDSGLSPDFDPSVQLLNRLTAKALGSRDEFLTFADKAKAAGVFELCMAVKQSREDFALDLQHLVSRMGGEPVTEESFGDWVHNAWTSVKLAFEPDKDPAVVQEMINEERSMEKALAEALEDSRLSVEAQDLIRGELEECRRTLQSMLPLEVVHRGEDSIDTDVI